ncbi:unnamed protein product [Hydatigera taeniaeformis]|uniref:Transmembrane protein n=1 Tax=Hydatigena taeniaeformis TaxID=6205 RepID=A0A0R3WNU9_HYDTA|nr:unnamed protein product [Hydatigera taeniaeformis]
MELSDDDLRNELAKYMDPVPPATGFVVAFLMLIGSTREVLKAKLAKLQASKPKEASSKSAATSTDNSPDRRASSSRRQAVTTVPATTTPAIVENRAPAVPVSQPSPERRSVADVNSATSEAAFHDTSKSRNDSVLYEDSEYRIRYFPSAELPDYPGGLPVFRRRSLHPSGNQVAPSDPYEEFYIRSPRLQAKIDAERIISRVMTSISSPTKHPHSRVQASCDFLSHSLLGLLSLLLAPFALVRALTCELLDVGVDTLFECLTGALYRCRSFLLDPGFKDILLSAHCLPPDRPGDVLLSFGSILSQSCAGVY